ncbi:MAG: hypothetical protein HY367_02925 [Candidatus Aenigmarchaeota archaeon]|nr:hypothetical protein [Candidatus Aenigmarchaeota archaeon]
MEFRKFREHTGDIGGRTLGTIETVCTTLYGNKIKRISALAFTGVGFGAGYMMGHPFSFAGIGFIAGTVAPYFIRNRDTDYL